MIIAIASIAALVIGMLMMFFGFKLVRFSLKGLLLLTFCFGISFGFWRNFDKPAPSATVVGDQTIEFDYNLKEIKCTTQPVLSKKDGKSQVKFLGLPQDNVFVASTREHHRYYQIERDGPVIKSVVELKEPIGWMVRFRNKEK